MTGHGTAMASWPVHGVMSLPKQITFVTFDVYGTLIDWDNGALAAFREEAERDGFTVDPAEVVPLFHSVF